jgi:hypothetical protein
MIIPGMIKRGSTMVDHFGKPIDPAASAHRDGFGVRESWIDRVAVLSVIARGNVRPLPGSVICESDASTIDDRLTEPDSR